MKQRNILIIALFVLFVIGNTFSLEYNSNDEKNISLSTAAEAVNIALLYTGFDVFDKNNLNLLVKESFVTTYIDSLTPFLSEQMNGNRAWKISFKSVSLKSEEQIETNNYYPRDFEIFIDSTTGQFLEMRSFDPNIEAIVYPEISATMAEEQMKLLQEKYLGLPKEMPNTNIIKALSTVQCSAELSKLIIIKYVVHSLRGDPPIDAWIIHLHGVPKNSRGYTHMRSIINANNGFGVLSTNWPSPTKEYLKKIGWDKNK